MNETNLLPCPFCGAQAALETQVHSDVRALHLHWHAKVSCVSCFASTGWVIVSDRLPGEDYYVSQDDISKDRVQDVVETWNTRVPGLRCPPAKVYMAHNRTSSLLFASKEDAEEYAAACGPTAGVHVTECLGTGATLESTTVPEEWRQTVQAYMDSYDAAWNETITTLFNKGITEVSLSDLQVDHLNKLQGLRDLLTNRRSASNG